MGFFSRKTPRNDNAGVLSASNRRSNETSNTTLAPHEDITKSQLKRATRTRKIFALLSSFSLVISVIFLILVEVGNTKVGHVLSDIYFLRLDLSQIVPASLPDAQLLNTIAQSIGLHDYYQTGLWNYCEGYVAEGITSCAKPKVLYWFNPIEILLSQLLAGATIALPTDLIHILKILKTASQYMFALFLTGTCFEFVMIFIVPLSLYSRWAAFVVAPLTFLAALCTTVATVVATVLFIIFRNAIQTAIADINIKANIGIKMFAFMWIATAFAILAWLIQMGLCCCCASRRDIRTGKKRGSKHAHINNEAYSTEKPPRRGMFRRRKV